MPELPEAEIARRQLQRWLGTTPFREARAIDPAVVRTHLSSKPSDAVADPAGALAPLVGTAPTAFLRHGKRFGLVAGDRAVLVHLGMSGKLVQAAEKPPYARLALVTDGDPVWLVDRRRFGCVSVVPAEEADSVLREGHGPDALDEALSADGLRAVLKGGRAVKVALMDQALLAGIGNIQAAEILFRARVDPRAACKALTDEQVARIAAITPAQLQEVIDGEDAGEIVYVTDGGPNVFAVYGREGEPCPSCATPIETTTQGGRTTYWCPSCQR
ncbi:MAG: bifunctional DNA-formamidopyrimidine glycosylase/DNA-(apurinic or apyrimidinic site) lyase [Myxococcales bacterium]|nr:bifunctional DNA-formamidopyrimidine glycosylase/DNA-(apurinic or apyrimidinic site) lyase [Myxococcales bacterium]